MSDAQGFGGTGVAVGNGVAVAPPTRRRRRWLVGLVVVPFVFYGLALVAVDLVPQHRYSRSGLRIWPCQAFGGSIPPDLAAAARVQRPWGLRELRGHRVGTELDGRQVIAADVVDGRTGESVGTGVWVTERWGRPDGSVQPVDDLARQVSTGMGPAVAPPGEDEREAVRNCRRAAS